MDNIRPLINSAIRHTLTLAAGYLGTIGMFTADQQAQFVNVGAAVVLFLFSYIWSAYQKRHQQARVVEAAATGQVK